MNFTNYRHKCYNLFRIVIVDMNKNKEVLNLCKNYYKIVNYEYDSCDEITNKIICIYREYIFKIDLNSEDDIETVQKIDEVLGSYIDDLDFREELNSQIVYVKIPKTENILKAFVKSIINIFNNYIEFTTRSLYLAKWI